MLLVLSRITSSDILVNEAFEGVCLALYGADIFMILVYWCLPCQLVHLRTETVRQWCKLACFALAIVELAIGVTNDEGSVRIYAYLLLLLVHNASTFQAMCNLAQSLYDAAGVIFLFFAANMVIGAMAYVLLRGKHDTREYYVDQQFQTYLRSFITMYVFISTASNFGDVVDPILELPDPGTVVYIAFFLFCVLVGLFFIFALLIDMFYSNFERIKSDYLTQACNLFSSHLDFFMVRFFIFISIS